ncbi:hypothetical protein ACIBU0_16120 [Streptomyces sp. NPDC049627]|uniref:hypothetical protein n=1 Tax=Streptomyces sp. NPDC049627 TaxID=3365595 RepID=UPI0037BAE926
MCGAQGELQPFAAELSDAAARSTLQGDAMPVHTNVTPTEDSYTGGETIHTGRRFFDPDIDTEVRVTSPYAGNIPRETQLSEPSATASRTAARRP